MAKRGHYVIAADGPHACHRFTTPRSIARRAGGRVRNQDDVRMIGPPERGADAARG